MRHTGWCSSARVLLLQALITLVGIALSSSARAGRNANGALVVHVLERINGYTVCDLGPSQVCSRTLPTACADLLTEVTDDVPTLYILASFTEISSPGVSAIRFGITHNLPSEYWIVARCSNPCIEDAVEYPDPDWPLGSGQGRSGNSVVFSSPVYDRFFKFYYFGLEGIWYDGGPYFFATSPYSEMEPALFYDDATPPNTDICANFGIVRWLQMGYNQCPHDTLGACCFEDGTCEVILGAACSAQHGTFLGYFTTCDSVYCPQPQACCLCDGECRFLVASACEGLSGEPQGGGTTCDPSPCQTSEACCIEDGTCLFTTPCLCRQAGGLPWGAGTVCDPNPCSAFEACCFPDGTCQFTAPLTCQQMGGLSWGPGTLCDPNPCPQPRACCFPDGHCDIILAPQCVADGGLPQGERECEPNPCLVGACCINDACEIYSSANCASHDGVYMGDGTLCSPNPCVSSIDDASEIPSLHLSALPNPSTGQVVIRYHLPEPTTVTIEVFNAAGELLWRVSEGVQAAGQHSMRWDGKDDNGDDVPSGVYVARIVTTVGALTERLVLMR